MLRGALHRKLVKERQRASHEHVRLSGKHSGGALAFNTFFFFIGGGYLYLGEKIEAAVLAASFWVMLGLSYYFNFNLTTIAYIVIAWLGIWLASFIHIHGTIMHSKTVIRNPAFKKMEIQKPLQKPKERSFFNKPEVSSRLKDIKIGHSVKQIVQKPALQKAGQKPVLQKVLSPTMNKAVLQKPVAAKAAQIQKVQLIQPGRHRRPPPRRKRRQVNQRPENKGAKTKDQ